MSVDESALHELLEQSGDLHSDAMRVHRDGVSDIADFAADTCRDDVDPEQIEQFNAGRRELVGEWGATDSSLLKKGAIAGGVGALLAALLVTPAAADEKLDVQILQTASSLEILAVATYGAALTLPFIKNGNAVVKKFAQTT